MVEARARLTVQLVAVIAFAALLAAEAFAQPIGTRAPTWKDLSASEKQVLAPFAPEFDQWDAQRRLKWRGIAQRYPKMDREQQQRVDQQMRTWAELTPDQRRIVREQYKSLKSLPPEKKHEVQQKWQEYQSLPPETRQELATKAPPTARPGAAAGASSSVAGRQPNPPVPPQVAPAAPQVPPSASPAPSTGSGAPKGVSP